MNESYSKSYEYCLKNNDAMFAPKAAADFEPKKKKERSGPRGGVYDPFPMKVHRMLDQSMVDGNESIVSWLPHGRAFKIHKPKAFADIIMPRFFNQSKYTSFQRQLNLYGFNRLNCGPDLGSYYHELFLRGKPSLATSLLRQKIKGCGHKTMKLLDKEPDFYAMPPLKEDSQDIGLSNIFAPSTQKYLPAAAVVSPLDGDINAPTRSSSLFESKRGSEPYQSKTPPSMRYEGHQRKGTLEILAEDSSAQQGGVSFVNELNKTIFMHELAMGCSILCQLRRGNSTL